MIVVLILTSIVVGMAFSVLSLVQKHMTGIQSNFTRNTELNKLEQSLWIDFNSYSKIKYNEKEAALVLATEVDSIAYKFTNNYVVKEVDTFNVQLQQWTFFFDGSQVNNGKVDAIKLETSKAFQNQPLFIFKQNDATLFMN